MKRPTIWHNFLYLLSVYSYNSLLQLVGENERYERQVELLCGNRSAEDGADGDHGCTDDSKEVRNRLL